VQTLRQRFVTIQNAIRQNPVARMRPPFKKIQEVFKPFSIFDSIKEIYPNIDSGFQLQNTFKTILRVGSLTYDQVMQWPGMREVEWLSNFNN
jgi:hypothetical protein